MLTNVLLFSLGCFALIVQAFCDAYGKFRFFAIKWPGATPDITAYKQTELYNMFDSAKIPEQYHTVLDEAYASIGGNQHLCPYSKHQMRAMKDIGLASMDAAQREEEYRKMRAFCHILSSQRITIERAFGMFIRKFGIMWRAMEYGVEINTLIVMVCAKLHNLCIDEWKRKGKSSDFIFANQERRRSQQETANTAHEAWDVVDLELPTDAAVRLMMDNYQHSTRACHNDSDKRRLCKENIAAHGFVHDDQFDNDYVNN